MDFWIEAEEGTRLDVSSPFRCGGDGADVFVRELSLCLIVRPRIRTLCEILRFDW
jgi:hypothetical protein